MSIKLEMRLLLSVSDLCDPRVDVRICDVAPILLLIPEDRISSKKMPK